MSLVPARVGLLARVAGFTAPVGRRHYLGVGALLMALKYVVEAWVVHTWTGGAYPVSVFLSPLLSARAEALAGLQEGGVLFWAVWTLPFAWIGTSMSVRRARDAGLPGAVGLLFLFPFVNALVMAAGAVLPSRPVAPRPLPLAGSDRVVWSALVGVAAGTTVGLGMVGLSVYGLGEYGGALFVGTPTLMGTTAGFLLNLRRPQGVGANLLVGTLTVTICAGLLLLFALEGAICIAMAAPICLVMSLFGVALGRALAAVDGRVGLIASQAVLPLLAVVEPPPTQERMVESRVVVDAPPERVWDAVLGFGGVELPPPPEWYFRAGVAYPVRARIEGEGVGAVRRCEFSTGAFVEPIHTWDPPRRLGFDVTESPPTMHEWSLWERVHAPHLDGILRSRHGEFELRPMAGGGTELVGRTWYVFDMAPGAYWGLWSDAAIHAIHGRVLRHVAAVAEAHSASPSPDAAPGPGGRAPR